MDAPPPFGRHYQDDLYTQDYSTLYYNTIANDPQILPQSDSSREAGNLPTTEAVGAMYTSDMTPSYEMAVQIPEMYRDRNSDLPAYDRINSDSVDSTTGEYAQIAIPLPAVCRTRQLN